MGEFNLFARVKLDGQGPASRPKSIFTTLPPPAASEAADKGLVIIQGSSGSVIELRHSFSENNSRTVKKEVQRTYSEVSIFNPDDRGQKVDVQRPETVEVEPKQVYVRGGGKEITIYAKQPQQENVEVISEGNVQKNVDASSITDAGP